MRRNTDHDNVRVYYEHDGVVHNISTMASQFADDNASLSATKSPSKLNELAMQKTMQLKESLGECRQQLHPDKGMALTKMQGRGATKAMQDCTQLKMGIEKWWTRQST